MKKVLIIFSVIIALSLIIFGINKSTAIELNNAIKSHDIAGVEKILDSPFAKKAVNTPSGRTLTDDTKYEPRLPIQWAALESQPDIIKLLINAGADVNKVTKHSITVLLYVLEEMNMNDLECIDILLKSGANVDKTEYFAPISLYAATQSPYRDCEENFDAALSKDSVEIYEKIVNISSDRTKETILKELNSAVSANNFALVKYIIENNKQLDINHLDKVYENQTLLFALRFNLCDKETIKIAKFLIKNGIDKTIKNDEEKTAYDVYIKFLSKQDEENRVKNAYYKEELKNLLKP